MFGLFKKIFGTAQSRLLHKYRKIVAKVNEHEAHFQSLSEEELIGITQLLKQRCANGESLDSLLPEAYAVVKNTCRRLCGREVHVSGYNQPWDMVPYDVQILGAIALHFGSITEMMTGEGKTLTAAMPLYLNTLSGQPVHLVTVNDYLASRDCQLTGEIFRFHGLTVKALTNDVHPQARKEVYAADVVYGTASEFGFDYLRDNSMAHSADEQCQRGHFFGIIDEVDSILIDEARTPLIISGPTGESRHMYQELDPPVDAIVRVQRDLCNKYATEAKHLLEKLGQLTDEEEKPKLSKEEGKQFDEALQSLWLVGKGNPQNKILRRIKENPDLRNQLEKWEIFFHGDANKEDKLSRLANLYLIVDEKGNEFELTDKGIHQWIEAEPTATDADFTMLDLGHEYALIDAMESLSEQEKVQKKVTLREEDAHRKERSHNLRQLLRAHLLMEKDVDYIVSEGKIVIIDENTGRPQPGRRFSDGLHQAIEAKEGVEIQGETQTYATITLQNYFRLYKKLAGMTGTAMTEASEFKEIYKLEVLSIPTHKKCVRVDSDDEIYMTEREKYNALIEEIKKAHGEGRPILIGTESVEASEKLSRILRQNKLPHTVLNAKNHAKEAEIIADAGKEAAITVATNMAGRGTDIKLKPGIASKGGLYVIGTTRHTSRRIDRQLRGRCARQGDPGSSKFYVSFEDTLMRLFTSPRVALFLKKFRPPPGEPISASVLNKSIETAQKRVEQRNYTMRKHTLEYDDVMNKQRAEIYSFRNETLHTQDPLALAAELLEAACGEMATLFLKNRSSDAGWNPEGYQKWLMSHFPLTFDLSEIDSEYEGVEAIEQKIIGKVVEAFTLKIDHQVTLLKKMQPRLAPHEKEKLDPRRLLGEVVRNLIVRNIDRLWQEHLHHIDHLRTEVGVRTIGQKDPLLEFKHEAFALFDQLSRDIKAEIAHALFKFEMAFPKEKDEPDTFIDLPRKSVDKKKELTKQEKRPLSPTIDLSLLDL